MTSEILAKLMQMLAYQDFYDGLKNCTEPQDTLAYFVKHEIALNQEEALAVQESAQVEELTDTELTDEELKTVLGGTTIYVKVCVLGKCSNIYRG